MSQGNILVVDDIRDSRLLLMKMLEDVYTITEADSGEACLELVKETMPDLVLMDVEMPGMNGYETCIELRRQQETRYLPVIFISALDSTRDQLDGFKAGGQGYLIKPVDEDKLRQKITACIAREKEIKLAKIQLDVFGGVFGDTLQQMNDTNRQMSDANNVAMEAMTFSNEQGMIIEFVKQVQQTDNADAVGLSVVNIARQFSLRSAALLITDRYHFVGCAEDSLEAELLRQVAATEKRIFSVGIRTVVRNKHILLLIKDMPLNNEKLYGRLKDHLAVFMDIADGHLMTLEARREVLEQRTLFFNQIIDVTEKQINNTSNKLFAHDSETQKIMQDMLAEMESMLFSLGLEEDQEEKLMHLADQAKLKLEKSAGSTRELSDELGVILEKLYEFQAR